MNPCSFLPSAGIAPRWSLSPVWREVAEAVAARTVIPAGADGLCVFWTTANQSPGLLRLIGRERELAFRAVGEGTGHVIDLDAFDPDYLHLCAWDVHGRELVGAYRMRYIAPSRGLRLAARPDCVRLYTQTLFDLDHALLEALSPALELGRAFVRAPYQKGYAPLMLLWRGIGRMVARFPGVRHLFGAASISEAHTPEARALMLRYLRAHAFDETLAALVSPRHPPDVAPDHHRQPCVRDLHALNAAVAVLNPSGATVPVLLRHYLKLGARVLGFNRDPLFHDAIDALVVIDLDRVPPAMRHRYLPADAPRALDRYERRSA